VLGDSSKVNSAEIKVMNNSGGQYFVVQEGIEADDRIVLEGVASLREGLAIKPREVNADSIYRQIKD
jgi:membrane fusion protein (multidrug efflux system)